MKIKMKDIILILVALILIAINIYFGIKTLEKNAINNYDKTKYENAKSTENNTNEEDATIEKLKDMSERERMEYYFSEFMNYIETGKYQEAYDLLYPDFKEKYFKTVDEFKIYVNKTYPDFVSFNYNDIDRQGYIYVLTITVINPEEDKEKSKKNQKIVVKENDFNDFVLSFQVI